MNLAFISYSHHDAKIADWLQTSLEHYRLPSNMPNPINPQIQYLRPIFRDRTDLTTGVLSEVIDKNLENSKYLILICSRRAARSEWVSKEVQYFIEHDRINQIIPLVIDGIPYSGGTRECIPKYMRDYVAEHPEKELLCIDKVAEGDHRAFMQVVSRLMDVPFDVMYERHRRRRNRIIFGQVVFFAFALATAGYLIPPIYSSVQILDEMPLLPHGQGTLVVDGHTYMVTDYSECINLPSLPGYMRGRTRDIQFFAPNYDTIQTSMKLGYGFSTVYTLQLKRDDTFSVFQGCVVDPDGTPISGATVTLSSHQVQTDEKGTFCITLPIEAQAEYQSIQISKEGYLDCIREDECPSRELAYILYPL